MTHQPAASASASALSSAQPRSERNSNQVTCRLARNVGFRYAAAFLLFLHVVRPAHAQTLAPAWTQLSPANSPQERYIHAMTYDAGHSQVVLFGGFGQVSPFYLNDTWLWNGSNWTQANPATSPDPRAAHALVYDAAHGNVVLFGGTSFSTNRFGDTWLWDGTNWTQAHPAASPSARDGAVMVYDATNHNVVLFGGSTGSGSVNDTWTWDGSNWTQLSPSSSPTARADYSMVYDAAHGQVVLFGGSDNSGFRNDTWIWNGSSWTQQVPANSPPARDTQGMAYDSALGEVVMWGGHGSSGFLNDTWAWDGTNWTQLNSPTTPPVGRYAPNAVVYDSAQNQFLLFSGQNASQVFDDTWTFGPPQNFGNINVCPSGQNSPAPCSNTLALTYNFSINATLGSTQVVTQGLTGLDFSQANGGNCSGTILPGHSCTIDITFAPTAPGLRTGAVTLYDNDNTPIATTLIYGNGQAPLVAFGLLPTQPVDLGTFSLNGPKGVVVDPAGTFYIADTGNGRVLQSGVGGVQIVGFGFSSPQGLALDGAGDLFIADPGISPSGEVVEIPSGCTSAACQVVVYNPAPHPSPVAVAVDGTGNVYVADDSDGIVKIPPGCLATVSTNCQSTVGTGWFHPTGVALDASGDLFVSDSGLQQVIEFPSGCTTSACQIAIGTGWQAPASVSVNAAGDVFVADMGRVVEFLAGCTGNSCQLVLSNATHASDVIVDAAGDIYNTDDTSNQLWSILQAVPSLSFSSTNVGHTSPDSPQTVTMQNIGNQTLNYLSQGLVVSGAGYVQVPGSDPVPNCPVNTGLAPGSICELDISFTPPSVGPLTGSAVFTDNNLNALSTTQTLTMSGSGLGGPVTVSVVGSGVGNGSVVSNPTGIQNCDILLGLAVGSCSASFTSGAQMSLEEIPAVGYVFTGWGNACANSGTNQICVLTPTTSTTVSASFAPVIIGTDSIAVTLLGSGGGTVTDNSTGINCTLAHGNFTGTCNFNYQVGSQLTLTANPAAGSTFLGWGAPCSGTSPTCTFTVDNTYDVAATFEQQSFGNVNVCPPGQNSPAPCSQNLTFTFTIPQTTTIGVTQVVTQGVTGLDFALASGGTCTGTISGGNSCTVTVTFTPRAPGLRTGAITLFDSNGVLINTRAIYGIGQAPLAAFSPGTQTTTSGVNGSSGVAVDAAGNVYVSNNTGAIKISPSGAQSTVPTTGITGTYDIAVDGAGNVFIADVAENRVVKVTPSGVQTTVPISGLTSPTGVAVDGAGNLFVTDLNNNRVVKITPDGLQTTLPTNGVVRPYYPAVDAAGDVLFLDAGNERIVKVAPDGTQSIVPTSGLAAANGLAVDAAGDVFISDQILNVVFEISPSGVQTTVPTRGLYVPAGLAVDAAGNLFIADNGLNSLVEINRSQPPSLSFPLTNAGTSSGVLAVSLQNVGNQSLSGTLATSSLGPNFVVNGNSTCGNAFSLNAGSTCLESFNFTPQTTGYFTATASFSDNTLNLSPGVVLQQVTMNGIGGLNGQATTTAVPNVVGLTQAAAGSALTGAGLASGSISTASSSIVPSGSVIASNPPAGTQANLNSSVKLLVSSGPGQAPTPNPLTLLNNYFVTGDYASGGVTLRTASPANGMVTGTINIPAGSGPGSAGVPTGADLIDGFLYWMTLESSASPSGGSAVFLGYPIAGQQIGRDLPFTDTAASKTGTLRVYRADVNTWFQNGANGIRIGSGNFTVATPGPGGGTNGGVLLSEGASLVVIYRVLSPNFPLKAVVIYDGSATPASSTSQNIQGFYDAAGGGNASGNLTSLFVDASGWNNTSATVALGAADHYNAPINGGAAYGAVILSTLVNNPDNDGILGAWKSGPAAADFHGGEPGYYDVKTGSWVGLPGAKAGQKDLFVQLDYMCAALLPNGSCDPNQENLFPAPDAQGRDPLAMVQQAFANSGIALHLQVGNAVPEDTCTDSPGQPCQFPGEPGVVGWKNSLEFSKVWPRNFGSCAGGGDCSPRFAYGQKDSYHYVLFGHSLAIPAWNTRYASLKSINAVQGGTTTITTTDRGTGINACPKRITISGVQGMPSLNGVYDTSSCPDTSTIVISTPSGVTNWSYPNNNLPEPVIGITSGTVTSISGYSDLGGADSAVTLGLWETFPNQDMSKRANVIAGTLFHELGHTIGLGHGGIYYDTPGSFVPTFEANCKPNYQSIMNYLFQLDGVGPNAAVAFSNQTLTPLTQSSFGSVNALTNTDTGFVGAAATFPTSTWYVPTAPAPGTSPATLHCDGAPLGGDVGYRISGSIAPITPPWTNGQNITFDGQAYSTLRGFNDLNNIDLRQVGATGGQFASLSNVLAFGSSTTPLNIAPGGSVAVGPGGTVTLGAGGSISLAGGNVTVPSGGVITGGGTITFGTGGNITLGAGGSSTITPGTNGVIGLPSGGNVTLGGGGTITLGAGGTVTLGGGGNVTLGAGGTITIPGGGSITIPSTGGSYTVPAGGTITLGGGGNITLGGGGNITLGGGGNITLGGGGNITLGGGGNVTLGAGGTVTLGGGGNVTLGGGGNVTLGGGGNITLGGGGNVTLGGGGNVTLGGGGTVTLGAGGDVSVGSGGNVTLGAGGTVTLGAGGNITLGGGGNITLGGGGNITLGAGGTITLTSAGNVTLGAGGGMINGVQEPAGTYAVGAGGNITLGAGGNVTLGGGGNVTLGAGGNITLGGGGTVTLGGGGNITLGAGGVVTLGGGGNITLGAGGNITLGGGGNVTLGGGGATSTELDYDDANSIVRPPSSPTETTTAQGNVINWSAPAFGVVETYTISRSVNGGAAVVIGSVSGQNDNPPATTFTDTNPPAGTLMYTITTTLVPDQGTSTQRQSPPSPPAVVTYDQKIVLSALPSSFALPHAPVTITATISTSAPASDPVQQVNFAASGSCSIVSGSQSISNGTSSASVSLDGTGSCTITASQAGSSNFNPADPVSQSFSILPQGSNLQSQTINFAPLANVVYGGSFSLSATSSSMQPVSFAASGPCKTDGTTTGVGLCTITATAQGNSTYSSATVTQSFSVIPAVLMVKAGNLSISSGQPIPSLTNDYTITGFVNGDSAAVLNNTAPTLSTTATSSSAPGDYPITVSTGTLAATNYSFLYVPGTLTIQASTQTITFTTPAPATAPYKSTFPVAATSTSHLTVTLTVDPASLSVCTLSGGIVTMNSATGICTIDANQPGNSSYGPAAQVQSSATATKAAQSITFAQPASPVPYGVAPISVIASSTSGLAVVLSIDASSTAAATIAGNTLTIKGAGTLVIDANQTGNSNYFAAAQIQRTIVVSPALLTVTANNLSRAYGAANPALTVTYSGFVNSEGPGVLTGSPSLSTTATTASLPGQYPITVTQGTLASRNYTFKLVNGTLTVTATGAVPSSGTACNGAYTGTFKGSLIVSKGQTCIFISGGTTGSVTGTGGNIILQGATIGSSVTINSGGTFTIGPLTTINGSLVIQSLPKSTAVNQVCGSTITGSLVVQSDGAPILIGSGTTACAGNIIKGSLQVASNSAAVTMNGNNVSGSIQVQSNPGATTVNTNTVGVSVQIQSNTGAAQVFSNVIKNALQCQSNSSITGGGNTAPTKQGQCAKF